MNNLRTVYRRFEYAQRQICHFGPFIIIILRLDPFRALGKKLNIHSDTIKKRVLCIGIVSPAVLPNYSGTPAVEQISGCFRAEGQPRSSLRSGPLVLRIGPTESSYRACVPFTSIHLTSARRRPCLKGLPSGSQHRPMPKRRY